MNFIHIEAKTLHQVHVAVLTMQKQGCNFLWNEYAWVLIKEYLKYGETIILTNKYVHGTVTNKILWGIT